MKDLKTLTFTIKNVPTWLLVNRNNRPRLAFPKWVKQKISAGPTRSNWILQISMPKLPRAEIKNGPGIIYRIE